MSPTQILKKYWGYPSFRPTQDKVVDSICAGHDTLALLPTGGGKSICFQVPALSFPGLTIVVSPLVSLMKDQVDALKRRNIAATYLASSLSKQETAERLQLLQIGKYKIIYVAPERLVNKKFLRIILRQNISQLVVDEAHCISEWGHTFRPNYRLINKFITQIKPRPVVTAVTATATPTTAKDIIRQLKMENQKVFYKSFKRKISILIFNSAGSAQQEIDLLRLLIKHKGESGIIYCATRKATEQLSARLSYFAKQLQLAQPGFYHGGMSAVDRSAIQQLFLHDKVQVLCATNAFGMGIDKPNVSFVIHYQLPSSIEQYYQEIGRAGRGGQQATAYLLFNKSQLNINQQLIENLPKEQRANQQQKLDMMIKLATRNSCVTKNILNYFGEEAKSCGNCNRCRPSIKPLQLQTLADKSEMQNLYRVLVWKEYVASKQKLHTLEVLTDAQAQYLAITHPRSKTELQQIPGIGPGWMKSFGKQLLAAKLFG